MQPREGGVPREPGPAGSGGASEASGLGAYPWYVLVLLCFLHVSNWIDRQILAVLLEPIKAEFGATDTMMGFLVGPAFALFYTLAGIPIARLADRYG